MATKLFLDDIITGIKQEIEGNTNWGESSDSNGPNTSKNYLAMVLCASGSGGTVFASSTPLPVNNKDFIKQTTDGSIITFGNVPYTETLSTISTGSQVASGFALIKVSGGNFKQVEIANASGNLVKKYIIDSLRVANVDSNNAVFIGDLSTGQTIQPNNSFNLSAVNLSFN